MENLEKKQHIKAMERETLPLSLLVSPEFAGVEPGSLANT